MASIDLEYIAAGGNRHPAAADWNGSLFAFGAGKNIAVWIDEGERLRGIKSLLSGHTDAVNAVKIYRQSNSESPIIISGSSDKTVRIWVQDSQSTSGFREAVCLTEHQGSVNTIAVLPGLDTFVTGAADATLKIWKLNIDDAATIQDDQQSSSSSASKVGSEFSQ